MARYQVFHPDHQIIGLPIVNFKNAIGGEELFPYYAKHGFANVDPEEWYPLQNLLDVFNDIVDRGSAMLDLVSVGMKSTEDLILPPHIEAMPMVKMFQLSDTIYQMNNRGTNIGSIQCEVINDHYVIMTRKTPYPDDLWYGVGYGFARRFLPSGTQIHSFYDEETTRRDHGGTETKVHIEWG